MGLVVGTKRSLGQGRHTDKACLVHTLGKGVWKSLGRKVVGEARLVLVVVLDIGHGVCVGRRWVKSGAEGE